MNAPPSVRITERWMGPNNNALKLSVHSVTILADARLAPKRPAA